MAVTPIRKPEPRTPIFKSADPYFNHKAAQAAYEMVMKMDEDSARAFTEIVVSDAVEELIEKNLDLVQRRLDQVVAERTAMVKKALARRAVKDPESVLPYAQAVVLIEKAAQLNPYQRGYVWNEKDFNRDPGTGRFRTKVTHTQTKPISDKTAKALGLPEKRAKMSPQHVAQMQDEYRQLAAFLGTVYESTDDPAGVQVALHFEDNTGQRFVQTQTGTAVKHSELDPSEKKLIGIEAKPSTLNIGGAAFGLQHSLGRADVEGINRTTKEFPTFAESWVGAGDARNSSQRTFTRIATGSKFLGSAAPYNEQAQMAAAFGEFVGTMGPEAEKVIGPTARKTAYRYRGTEKTPDKELVDLYGTAIQRGKMDSLGSRELSPSQMGAARAEASDRSPTWEEREHGRRVIMGHLWNPERRPNQRLYALQLASGNTPPSEGVIINKNGQIVTQAVGYGDDHYLPFNLKNLKDLKGGEYIRTRSVGGLTSEDVYTGLISGARQVTVVSRSGAFTMTFEEDFRGGRRHNDKARRMTRRYEQILDAVQSEKVDRQDVSVDIRSAITRQVNEEYAGEPAVERSRLVRERIEEFKRNPEFSEADEDLANAMIRMHTSGSSSRDTSAIRTDIMNQLAAEKEYKFRLNGEGYAAALKALEEQFPYYITTRSIPTRTEGRVELERDKGYVEPSRNRPTEAQAGYFGTETNRGQKFSASHADYQRGRYGTASDRAQTNPVEATEARRETARVGNGTASPRPDADEPVRVAREIRAKRETSDSIRGLREAALLPGVLDPAIRASYPTFLGSTDEQFAAVLDDPNVAVEAEQFVKAVEAQASSKPALMSAILKYKTTAAAGAGRFYSEPGMFVWTPRPYEFPKTDGMAYSASPRTTDVDREVSHLSSRYHSVQDGRPLGELGMDELRKELTSLHEIHAVRKENYKGGQLRRALAEGLGLDPTVAGKAFRDEDTAFKKRVKAVHQMRWLKSKSNTSGTLTPVKAQASDGNMVDLIEGVEHHTKLAGAYHQVNERYQQEMDPEKASRMKSLLDDIQDAMRVKADRGTIEGLLQAIESEGYLA